MNQIFIIFSIENIVLRYFHRIGLLGHFSQIVAMSVCLCVCLFVCLSPPHAVFFKPYHWPSDHMISLRPPILQPFFRTILPPPSKIFLFFSEKPNEKKKLAEAMATAEGGEEGGMQKKLSGPFFDVSGNKNMVLLTASVKQRCEKTFFLTPTWFELKIFYPKKCVNYDKSYL